MIGHAVYLQHFVFVLLEDAGNVLMQPHFPCAINKGTTVFYGKYKLDMKLGITVSHVGQSYLRTTIRSYGTSQFTYFFYQPGIPMGCEKLLVV